MNMPLFKVRVPDDVPTTAEAIKRRDTILAELENVRADLAEMKGELTATSSTRKLQNQLNKLKEDISDAEIQRSRQEEDFARERRELEHNVGLERIRTDAEIEQARQQAKLDAREENLAGKEDLFDDHMKFYKEQMDKHIDDVKSLLNQVMTRIPTVNVDRKIRETTTRELANGDTE